MQKQMKLAYAIEYPIFRKAKSEVYSQKGL